MRMCGSEAVPAKRASIKEMKSSLSKSFGERTPLNVGLLPARSRSFPAFHSRVVRGSSPPTVYFGFTFSTRTIERLNSFR